MSLSVVKVDHDGTQGTVVVESDLKDFPQAIMELQSGAAAHEAIKAAAMRGLADPRNAGMNAQPYPVNQDGEDSIQDNGETRPLASEDIFRYRVDVPLTRRLV